MTTWAGNRLDRRSGQRFPVLIALLLSAVGCGDLTSGGAGDLEILITTDSADVQSSLQGTLTVNLQVFVRRGDREFEVTSGTGEVTLPLSGGAPLLFVEGRLPAGSYDGGRVIFHRIRANVMGGLQVGDEPWEGEVEVNLGAGQRLDLVWVGELILPEGGSSSIVLEMRASRWLRLLDREAGSVARDRFEEERPMVRVHR